jgi:hypothetical protein
VDVGSKLTNFEGRINSNTSGISSLSSSVVSIDTRLLEKEDKLTAGNNISIDIITDENGIIYNTISAIGEITIEDLDTKEDNIISTTDLNCNSITVSKTTPTENDELTSKRCRY